MSKIILDKFVDNYFKFVITTIFILVGISITLTSFGWDASFHTESAKVVYNLVPGLTLAQAYEQIPLVDWSYGIFVQAAGATLESIFTGKSISEISSNSVETYYWQGLVSISTMLISSLLISLALTKLISPIFERKYFLATFVLIWTTPLWFGYSTTNFKDMPVASGLLIIASSQIFYASNFQNPYKVNESKEHRHSLINQAFVFFSLRKGQFALNLLGAFIAMGTRISATILVLILFFSSLLYLLTRRIFLGDFNFLQYLKSWTLDFISLLCSIYLLLYLLHPIARINFIQWVIDSFKISNRHPWVGEILTAGQFLQSTSLPLWYIPAWTIVSMSVTWIILTLITLVIIFKNFKKINLGITLLNAYPLIVLGLIIPFAMAINGVIIYDGIRHLAFALIPLILLPWIILLSFYQKWHKNKFKNGFFAVILLLSIQLTESLLWYPYSYAYKNILFANNFKDFEWELDYWGASTRSGIDKLRQEYGLQEVAILPGGEMTTMLDGTWLGVIEGSDIILAAGKNMPDVLGVYSFNRFTWSRTADFPLNDCEDVPLATCTNMPKFECKILFEIERAGHQLGRGAACLNPAKNLSTELLDRLGKFE